MHDRYDLQCIERLRATTHISKDCNLVNACLNYLQEQGYLEFVKDFIKQYKI